MAEIYDLTLPLSRKMTTWPGDPAFQVDSTSSTEEGEDYNVSVLSMGTHSGTHVDAPRHVDASGTPVDQLPLDLMMGAAWVCRFPASVKAVSAEALEQARIPSRVRRILLATSNSEAWNEPGGEFRPEYVCLTEDAAEWLLGRSILAVGIDYLSIGQSGESGLAVHRALLSRGVLIIEGLDLRKIPGGPCQLCCLPMKLAGADGAPARVVALRDEWDPQSQERHSWHPPVHPAGQGWP
jgi:arylformamidase